MSLASSPWLANNALTGGMNGVGAAKGLQAMHGGLQLGLHQGMLIPGANGGAPTQVMAADYMNSPARLSPNRDFFHYGGFIPPSFKSKRKDTAAAFIARDAEEVPTLRITLPRQVDQQQTKGSGVHESGQIQKLRLQLVSDGASAGE